MDNSYPKYQYSYFLENGAQIVIRADNFTELMNGINKAVETYPVKGVIEKGTQPVGDQIICDFHKLPMKQNKNGKWYHMDRTRPEGDQFCNGYGFRGDKK